jgi:hypothetical protein
MSTEKTVYLQDHHRTPLALRARFEWTFFGLGLFADINLFLFGSFFLREALYDPISASTTTVVGSAFMLALATFLLAYLIWPRVKAAFATQSENERGLHTISGPVLTVYRDGDALRAQIEEEQALTLRKPRPDLALRRGREQTDSALPAKYGDAARARQ